ncbi:MAG: hypothetical protein ACO3PR_00095 [Limisphaerales bacterium]
MQKYGYTFPDGTSDATIELFAFKEGRSPEKGGLGKFEHFRNAVDHIWNDPLVPRARKFIWSPWAEDMIYEACENDYLAIAGCASSGKSDTIALWGIVNYLCSPADTLVMMTSTTLREARRRIWKSTMDLWNAVPGLPGKVVSSLGQIKGMNTSGGFGESTGIVLVPAEKSREKEAIGKVVGIKQNRLFLLADELPELPESLVHAAFTNLATNPYFQMIGLGNPNSHFDAFGMFSEPKDGWGSVTEADYEWETSRGKCIRFDAQRNPNVMAGRQLYPWMPSSQVIEQARKDYGENSLMFYRMYKGFWCPDGISNGIYSEADLVRGVASKPARFDDKDKVVRVAAVDPSFTMGGDRCIAYFGSFGQEDGIDILQFDEWVPLQEDVNDRKTPRSHQIARAFMRECEKRNVTPDNAAYDSTGGGGPFGDVLQMEWSDQVLAISFSGNASERPVSATDRTPAKDRYSNRMSEIWYQGQELLRSHQLRGIKTELAREMTSREYETKGTNLKIKVESKTDYKARVGKSPDIADAAFVLIDLCRTRLGLMGGERFTISERRRNTWSDKMRQLDIVHHSSHSDLFDT